MYESSQICSRIYMVSLFLGLCLYEHFDLIPHLGAGKGLFQNLTFP